MSLTGTGARWRNDSLCRRPSMRLVISRLSPCLNRPIWERPIKNTRDSPIPPFGGPTFNVPLSCRLATQGSSRYLRLLVPISALKQELCPLHNMKWQEQISLNPRSI